MKKTLDEINASIKSLLGDNISDEGVALLEDINDSFEPVDTSEFETRISELEQANETLTAEVQKIDANWRAKYVSRFGNPTQSEEDDDTDEVDDEPISDEDLASLF